jgi:Domain of unknown function (DUF4395)
LRTGESQGRTPDGGLPFFVSQRCTARFLEVAMQIPLRTQSTRRPCGGQIRTMVNLFSFGERIEGYSVPVLNERAVRAGAGIVFLFAIVAFMNAWLVGNFQPTRVFVVAFLIDFALRIFVNPRYAPSLILGQWIVRKQQPEYVGAPQKRFAWAIGFALALAMLYLVVIKHVVGPINLLVCAACLVLLFFETAFGICIGCKVYNWFHREQAQLCPGGVCEVPPAPHAGGTWRQGAVVAAFGLVMAGVMVWVAGNDPYARPSVKAAGSEAILAPGPVDAAEAERCKVPDFAKAMGHEDKWKLHNQCR